MDIIFVKANLQMNAVYVTLASKKSDIAKLSTCGK